MPPESCGDLIISEERPEEARYTEHFRQCFQGSLRSCIDQGLSVPECFGVIWEETVIERPLDEKEQGRIYPELLQWARNVMVSR